jgi:hypothetical protein
MAAATQVLTSNNGPVLFGVGGTLTYTVSGSPTWVFQITSASLTFQFDNVDATASGILFASAATAPHDMVTVEALWYDPAAGKTNAQLLAEFVAPTPKQICTLANVGARVDGDWNFEGMSQPRSNGQFVSTSFTLSRKGNDSSTGLPKAMLVVS